MAMKQDELIPTRWTLIKRLKNWDDQESWREFFDTYWRLIFSVAIKSGLTREEAEDAVQTTIMSVCKNIGQFKADAASGSFKSWLLKLTRWRIADQLRKRNPDFQERFHRHAAGEQGASTPTEETIPDPAANFLDAIWDDEWARNLAEAGMEKLKTRVNARQFQIFYLTVMKQSAPQQVAKVVGVSVNQVYLVKHRLSRVFQGIVKDLEEKQG